MDLNKDQIQKIALGLIMVTGLFYVFNEFMLRPLGIQRAAALKTVEELHPKIMEAKAQIARTTGLEMDGPKAAELTKQITGMIPDGAPVAWFPPRISELCSARGITNVVTRMNTELTEKGLPGFRKINWGVEITNAEFVPIATAIADFENEEPLLDIQALSIEAGRENAATQRVVITVNNLVRL